MAEMIKIKDLKTGEIKEVRKDSITSGLSDARLSVDKKGVYHNSYSGRDFVIVDENNDATWKDTGRQVGRVHGDQKLENKNFDLIEQANGNGDLRYVYKSGDGSENVLSVDEAKAQYPEQYARLTENNETTSEEPEVQTQVQEQPKQKTMNDSESLDVNALDNALAESGRLNDRTK